MEYYCPLQLPRYYPEQRNVIITLVNGGQLIIVRTKGDPEGSRVANTVTSRRVQRTVTLGVDCVSL